MSDGSAPTIAFDWNGTLVDDLGRACEATNEVLATHQLDQVDTEQFADAFRLPLRDFFEALGVADLDLAAAENQWNAAMSRGTPALAAGAAVLLEDARLSGFRTVVVSAAAGDVVRRDAQQLGILEHLDAVFGSAHPKSTYLRTIVQRSPGACVVYVGDTEYDMTEAVAAGATPVGYAGGYRPGAALSAAGAEHVVGDLADVLPLIRRRS